MKKTIPLTQVLVNTKNPRFEPVKNQHRAIDFMLEELGAEILRLAKDIVQYGLNPSKSLIVVQKDDQFLPLEGNRRVVALKLLHNPEKASDSKLRKKFDELKKKYSDSIPHSVDCVVLPNEEIASHWVMLEHTGENKGVGVVNWDSTQSQRFIAQHSGKKSRTIQIFDFADKHGIDHNDVASTSLGRIVATAGVPEEIGFTFAGANLDLTKPTDQVAQNLRKVFAAMSKNKGFKVSDVYTAPLAKQWVGRVLADAERPGEETRAVKEPDEKSKKPSIKKDPLKSDWITNELHHIYPKENRVKAILKELTDCKPIRKPNICATSVRVLLELAVYDFLKDKGGIKTIIAEEKAKLEERNRKRQNKRELEKDWSPNFHRMLGHFASDENLIEDPLERKALTTYISRHGGEPFFFELNQFIHNPEYQPSPGDVLEIWHRLGKLLFRNILRGLEK